MSKALTEEKNRRWLVALGLFTLAFGLRMLNAGRWSFWVDEVLGLWRADELILSGAVTDDWPKLSLLLRGLVLRTFGVSHLSARIVSIVLGSALIPTLYLSSSRLVHPRAGFWAALFLALSPWHVFLCQNARYYSALLFFMYLAMVLVCGGKGRGTVWRYALAAMAFLLAFAERLYAAVAVPVLAAFVLCRIWPELEARRSKGWRQLFVAYVGMLLLAGIAAAVVFLWVREYVPVVDKILGFIGRTSPHSSVQGVLSKLISDFGMPLVALGVAGLLMARAQRPGLLELSALMTIHCMIVALVMGAFVRVFTRYVMFLLPCWAVLAGAAMHEVLKKKRLALVVVAGILPLTLYDRMWDDMAFFTGIHALAWRLVSGLVCVAVLAVWILRAWPQRGAWRPDLTRRLLMGLDAVDSLTTPAVILVLVYSLAHPVVAGTLYQNQAGMRLDWAPIIGHLEANLSPQDVVISGEFRVIMHYLDRPAIDIRGLTAEHLEDIEGRVWFVADHHTQEIMGSDVAAWIGEHCYIAVYDGYMYRGRWWDITLYECPSCGLP